MSLLYAIAGSLQRAHFYLQAHIPYLQIRFKNQNLQPHLQQIQEWVLQYPNTRIVINDDLEFAEQIGAWGVHLGQEDLTNHSQAALKKTPLNLGISTHSDTEIQRAVAYEPFYLGFGPVFATQTKEVQAPPRGVPKLRSIVQMMSLPIVAIGGINRHNLVDVAKTGVHAIAMISELETLQEIKELQHLKRLIEVP